MSTAQVLEPLFPGEQTRPATPDVKKQHGGEILDLLLLIARSRKVVLRSTLLFTLLTLVVLLFLPNSYTAEVLLLPPDSAQSSAQVLLGQLSPLVTLAGGATMKSPVEMYGALATSEVVEGALVTRFQLKAAYGRSKGVDAMRDLDGATKIKPLLKEGLLQIKVTDTDPKRAAELANGYAEEMAAVTTRMSVHDGEIRLQFYGAQLNEARDELARAEADLQQIQEKTGILDLGTEARVSIEMVADLRAQIAARQVEIASMGAWATAENPQHRAAEEQLAALRTQLAKASEGHSSQELGLPKSKMPEEGAAYLRAYREVTYREALTEALERQYEAARMDASRVTSVVQVLSPAVVPERKSGPHRALILLAAIIVGFFASSLGVVMYERCRIMLQTEAVRSRVAEICRLLSLRSA